MKQLIPAIAFPPGEILKEELEASDLTQQDLSAIEEGLPQKITEIIQGNQQITPEIAAKLSQALGTSPEFWMKLEDNYCIYLANQAGNN
jgi:HTH-type transcriptional regulator/antitoxin HigA